MKHCINIRLKEFQALTEQTNMHPMVLAAKMGVYMEKNNTTEWPTLEQIESIILSEKSFDEQLSQYEKDYELYQTKLRFDEKPTHPMSEEEADSEFNEFSIIFPESALSIVPFETLKTINGETAYRIDINLDKPIKPVKSKIELSKEEELTADQISENALKEQEEKDSQLSINLQKKNQIFDMYEGTSKAESALGEDKPGTFTKDETELDKRTEKELKKLKKVQRRTQAVLHMLATNIGKRTGVSFKVVTDSEMQEIFPWFQSGDLGAYDDTSNTAYIVSNNADETTVVHELFSHPFLDYIKSVLSLKSIYENLLFEAKATEGLEENVRETYKSENIDEDAMNDEIVARALDMAVQGILNEERHKTLIDAIKAYFKAFTDTIKEALGIRSGLVFTINEKTTISELAKWALNGEGQMRVLGDLNERESIVESLDIIFTDKGESKFDELYKGMTIDQFIDSFDVNSKDSELLKNWMYEHNPANIDDLVRGVLSDLNREEVLIDKKGFVSLQKKIFWKPGDMTENAIKAKEFYVHGLKSRAAILKKSKALTRSQRDEFDKVINEIENSDEVVAAMKFVEYAMQEGLSTEKELKEMTTKMKVGDDIDANRLISIYNDFLKMFDQSIKNISVINNNEDSIINKYASKTKLKEFKENLNSVKEAFQNLDELFQPLFEYKYRNKLQEIAATAGSPTMDMVVEDLYNSERDVTWMSTFVGSPSMSRVEQIRALDFLLTNINNQVRHDVSNSGWISKLSILSKKMAGTNPYVSFMSFYEHHEGKATGFLLSKLKYGVFLKDYNKFMDELAEEFDLNNTYESPLDPVEYKKFIEKKDKFLEEHAERMFTPEYYNLKHSLSPMTSEVLDDSNKSIRAITDKYINEFGVPDAFNMTLEDSERLFTLRKEKEFLSSDKYQGTGLPKFGRDLEIANELKSYNENMKGKLDYHTNKTKFNQAKSIMKSTLAPEEYMRWVQANTKVEYEQSFWDDLASLEKENQTPQWQALYDQKQAILKSFRDTNTMEIRVNRMEASRIGLKSVKEWIDSADSMLSKYKNQSKNKNARQFGSIADMVKTKAYLAENAKYTEMALGNSIEQKISEEWFAENHTVRSDGVSLVPKGYWMKIEPKDKSLIKRDVPNASWSELDENSIFYNNKYEKDMSDYGLQPNKILYDNSSEFNKMMSSSDKAEFYNTIIEMRKEADSMLDFIERPNPLLMPQISGNSVRRMFSENNLLKGIWNEIKDIFAVRSDESEYGGDVDKLFRPDSSIVKNIPVFYRKMLDNPSAISKDMIHIYTLYYTMAANYKRQNENHADVQVLLEGLNRTSASNKTLFNKIGGAIKNKGLDRSDLETTKAGETNIIKRARGMVDRSMYGINSNRMTASLNFADWRRSIGIFKVLLPNSNIKIDIAKPFKSMLSWFRMINLAYNPLAIVANYATAEINMKIEAEIGLNMNEKDLWNANIELIKILPEALMSLTRRRFNNKVVALTRLYGVAGSEAESTKDTYGLQLAQFTGEHIMYGPYTAGDFLVKSRMLIAVLKGYKLDGDTYVNRNEFITKFMSTTPGSNRKDAIEFFNALPTNLYDSFIIDKKSGQLSVDPKYKAFVTQEVMNKSNMVAERLAAKLDGVLVSSDRNAINTNAIASALMMHRGWMVGAIQDRFGGRMFNYTKGMMDEGQYRTLATSKAGYQALLNILTFNIIKPLRESLNTSESYKVYNIKRTLNEVKYMVITAILTSLLKPDQPDKDKEKPSTQEMLYIAAMRVLYEQNAVFSPADALGILKSPTAAQNQWDVMFNITDGLMSGTLGTEIQRGKYKGKTKGEQYVTKLIPGYKNIYENFLHPDLQAKELYMRKNIGLIFRALGPTDPNVIKKRNARKKSSTRPQ